MAGYWKKYQWLDGKTDRVYRGWAVRPWLPRLIPWVVLLAILLFGPWASAAVPGGVRTVVVLYPANVGGSPGIVLVNQSILDTFASSSERIQVRNEYLDFSSFQDDSQRRFLAEFLRRKYSGQKIDLVMVALASSLDFALEYREEIFPGVPIVFIAVDQREVQTRKLPPDVIGAPAKMDLAGSLDLALRLAPQTRRVFVIAGSAEFDAQWAAVARQSFRPYEDKLEFVYLTGLAMEDLLSHVVHGLSRQLHPSKLEQLGLVAAVGSLCKETDPSSRRRDRNRLASRERDPDRRPCPPGRRGPD